MTFSALDKMQVRHHFSEHAGEYDLYARVQKRVAGRLLELLPGTTISGPALDVGTGTGEVARRLSELHPQRPLYVSDIAHDMTRVAQANLPGSFAADGDAQSLPFRSESFSVVLSSSVFQWLDDLPAAFNECRRVLKPGGVFAFAMFCDGTLAELRQVFGQALSGCRSEWPFHFQTFPERRGVETALEIAGFSGHRCHVETEVEYHGSFRDLMVGLKRIGAQNASRTRPKGLFPRRVLVEMSRLYDELFRSDDGLPASYGVLYGVVRKPA